MNLKHSLAELIGTFTFVFIGAGAGVLAGAEGGGGLLAVAIAHGVALTVIVYAWGPISGAHVNPAVTFGVAVAGKIEWTKAISYWIAQLIGAAAAAFVLRFIFSGLDDYAGLGETTGSLTDTAPFKTILIEAILTFFLVVAVFGSAVAGRNGNAFGLAIGLVLTMDILAGGPLTGASMNPARTFGPALATGNLGYVWLYVVGPLVGGGVAGFLYGKLFLETD